MKNPSYYTDQEGGEWMPWLAAFDLPNTFDGENLRVLTQESYYASRGCVLMLNQLVGPLRVCSLLWGPKDAPTARWDCLHGWDKGGMPAVLHDYEPPSEVAELSLHDLPATLEQIAALLRNHPGFSDRGER
jgi:hypothetical protein